MGADSRAKAKWTNERRGETIEYFHPWFHTCSACGVEMMEGDYDKFCPNCGAQMLEWCQPWTVETNEFNETTLTCPDCNTEIEVPSSFTRTVQGRASFIESFMKYCPRCGSRRVEEK